MMSLTFKAMTTLTWGFLVIFPLFTSIEGQTECGRKRYDYARWPGLAHTLPGEIPWQATILRQRATTTTTPASEAEKIRVCGGALIDAKWVITGAHCFPENAGADQVKTFVRVGDSRLKTWDVEVDEIRIYPGFEKGYFRMKGDLALLRLKTPLKLDEPLEVNGIAPACLPSPANDFRHSVDCFTSGFGHFSPHIRVETGRVVGRKELKSAWSRYYGLIDGVTENNIGFEKYSSKDGNCNCDSGGPLFCRVVEANPDAKANATRATGRWTLVGVISFGEEFGNTKPLVLTEVANFVEWISASMKYKTIKTCGVQGNFKRRVIGGHVTEPGEIPWQISIVHSFNHIQSGGTEPKLRVCGGTLIRRDWVLTAAHCFDLGGGHLISNATFWESRGGDWRRDILDPSEVDIPVKRIVGHPDYSVSVFGVKNDIALLKLERAFEIEEGIASVDETGIGLACLPRQDEDYRLRRQCILSGFGHVGFEGRGNASRPVHPKILQQAVGRVWPQKELKAAWNPLGGMIRLVNGDMIGFGMTDARQFGACSGDSGGPVVCPTLEGDPPGWPMLWPQQTLVGVVSFGGKECRTKPTVLTEVSKYRKWIERTVVDEDFRDVEMPDYERAG